MGSDKAFLDWHGRPLGRVVSDALREGGCPRVVASTRREHLSSSGAAELGFDGVVVDSHDAGPMGGTIAALDELVTDALVIGSVVVVAVDLPFLTGSVVSALLRAPGPVVMAHDGRPQPLCCRIDAVAAPGLFSQWASGERSLDRALRAFGPTLVAVDRLAVRDVDTPTDLAETRRLEH